MKNYYNFTKTNNIICYNPYLYDKMNAKFILFSGITLLVIGVIVSVFSICKEGIYFGGLFGGILLINGLYRFVIEGSTQIEFNKQDDALYKTTPLGKTKKIALSNIYDIITVTENGSYTYNVTYKDKPAADSIEITSFINQSRLLNPEIVFLENEVIPTLINFLQIDCQKYKYVNEKMPLTRVLHHEG